MSRTLRRLSWLILPILFTAWSSTAPETNLRTIILIVVWTTGVMLAVPMLALPMRFLRRVPIVLWLLWLIGFIGIIVTWLLRFQPAIGLSVTVTEQLWLVGGFGTLFLLPFAGYDKGENIKLGWAASPLLTLTTIVFIVIGFELALRYVWVMSDNFQFSTMHQNWNRLYWNPINDAGYRDNAVPSAEDDRQHILVMGDSLVTGYGVNHIEDTFPHLLDDQLGDDTTVNIVAQPGWGVASSFGAMLDYSIPPDMLILSHYINDINEGTAAQQYGRAFPNIRVEPTEQQRWWTDRFYLANFAYYRVFLYTQHDSRGLYNDWVYGAYADEQVWEAYEQELQVVVDWSQQNDVPLLVLVWADLINTDASQVLTQPVITFFTERDVPVVDMSVILADVPINQRIVNPFDAHPSVRSHQLAADALTELLSQ